MNSKYVRQVITATCDRARITGPNGQVLHFTPHDFRRSFATDALASGPPRTSSPSSWAMSRC